jgi:hypothetical protein
VLLQVLRLTQNGVPWDHAWSVSDTRRLAYLVAIGEMNGGRFSWENRRWEDKI